MKQIDLIYKEPAEFVWDKGNQDKNFLKHEVTCDEAEEIFFDKEKQEYPDPGHSVKEIRKIVVGKTKGGRTLLVVYTIRNKKVRVISARDINKEEKRLY